jgi:hypothetical protein
MPDLNPLPDNRLRECSIGGRIRLSRRYGYDQGIDLRGEKNRIMMVKLSEIM